MHTLIEEKDSWVVGHYQITQRGIGFRPVQTWRPMFRYAEKAVALAMVNYLNGGAGALPEDVIRP